MSSLVMKQLLLIAFEVIGKSFFGLVQFIMFPGILIGAEFLHFQVSLPLDMFDKLLKGVKGPE